MHMHIHTYKHTHTHTYTHTQMHMMFNFDLLLLLFKLCGMPPWFGDFLRLVSIGGASNWFGLVCPAHSMDFPYLIPVPSSLLDFPWVLCSLSLSLDFTSGLGFLASPLVIQLHPNLWSVLPLALRHTCMKALSVLIAPMRTAIIALRAGCG